MFKIKEKIVSNRYLVKKIKTILLNFGYNTEHLIRHVIRVECKNLIKNKLPKNMSILEISESEYWKSNLTYTKYTSVNYPDFDICENYLNEKFDLIIADNVWEHLKYPYKASKNIQKMLNKDGYFLVIVPFLVRLHEVPIDCTRWTEDGLKYYLEETGFDINNIETGSWGNKKSVISNLRNDDKWTRVGFYSKLNNEKNFPLQVCGLAKI